MCPWGSKWVLIENEIDPHVTNISSIKESQPDVKWETEEGEETVKPNPEPVSNKVEISLPGIHVFVFGQTRRVKLESSCHSIVIDESIS